MIQTDGKIEHVLDWNNIFYITVLSTQGNTEIQCNLYQITNAIFHRSRTKSHNSYGNTKDLNSQSNLEKEK